MDWRGLTTKPASGPDLPCDLPRLAEALSEAGLPAAKLFDSGPPDHLDIVRKYLRARRGRTQLLPAELFAEPAWDILLALYVSHIEGRCVSVASACDATAVPPATALRWLDRLVVLGLVQRAGNPDNRRQSFVDLSPTALEAIERWVEDFLNAARRGGAED
jgi:DNA-binding MarR family transcriptional regulator